MPRVARGQHAVPFAVLLVLALVKGLRVKPGEVSLARLGVPLLDQLPEFPGIR